MSTTAQTSAYYPTFITTTASSIWADNDWTFPNQVSANNGGCTYITASTYDNPDDSYLLKTRGYNFSIPTDAWINGILVEIDRCISGAQGSARDSTVCLSKDFTAAAGSDLKINTVNWPTGTSGVQTTTAYGGSSNLWGTTWTPSEVNSANFGVMFAVSAMGANTDVWVDFIRTTVYYTTPTVRYNSYWQR